MISLAELVRMPAGTVQTYVVEPAEVPAFLKKLTTYANRAQARVTHDIWLCVRLADDKSARMIICKVIRAGRQKRKRV